MTRAAWLRLAAYAFVVAAGALGFLRLDDTTDDLHDLIRSEAHEDEMEQDQACVNQHDRYRLLVRAFEEASAIGARVGTDAHLDLLQSSEAERHAAHGYIERRLPQALEPVLADYPPPSCDLEAAQRRLADQ